MTFTGNTLGLDKTGGPEQPWDVRLDRRIHNHTNTTSQVGSYPAGTTLTWSQNSSSAQLSIPAGSTILYAELIWGGNYISTDSTPQDVSAYLNNSITMTTPFGSYPISPDGADGENVRRFHPLLLCPLGRRDSLCAVGGKRDIHGGGVPATS